jgi:hypothetical protein
MDIMNFSLVIMNTANWKVAKAVEFALYAECIEEHTTHY